MWLTKAFVKSNTIIMESSQTESGNNDPGSCTSFSSSDIDDQVITELLAEQSRLYNALSEKYSLPLKEEQLLEKMFKTRPLYEILRSELLSSSTSDSSKTVTDLKLKPPSVDHLKALQKAEKNKDLCIVDDKSTVSEMKELSESCSCCLCCVKTRLHECVQIGRRNIQAHINEKIASRSNLGQQTNGETKNIKSDPCTCACNHKNIKECQRANFPQNFHIKQPDIRQRDRFLLPTKSKPLSPNNRKQRNSYHKLKRCYFTPYMENIGEGEIKKTQKFTKLLRDNADNKNLESMEKLKLLQQKIKDSFKANNNALPKLTPEKRRIFQNILNENNKNAFIESVLTQFIDKSYLDHIQNIETVQKCELKSRIHKRIHNENVIHPSNAATTNIRKTKNVTDLLRVATKQQKHPISKRIKNNQILVNMLQISNQVQTPKESNTSLSLMKRRNSKSVPSLLSTSSVTNITSIQDKHFSLTQNARKRSSYLINTNTSGIRVKILKSLSATSIDKSSRLGKVNSPNRFPSISSYNVNKITLKVNPLTSFHKMITPIQSNTTQRVVYKNLSTSIEKTTSELPKLRRHLNEEHLDQQKTPATQILEKSNTVQVLGHYNNENLHEIGSFHNKPMSPKLKTDLHQQSKIKSDEKDNKSSSYALKKCVCNLRIKVIDIRSKINKISAKQNKVKKSSKSNDQNPLKDWMKISRLSIRDTKQFKTQATKCDHSNSFKSLNIERKKRRKRNPSFKHHFRQWSDFKLKNNLTFKKQTEQDKLIQNIPYATWKSPIHTDSKNTIDKELVVSDIMNKESKCISYLSTYDSDKAKNTNMVCESTTRLKTTSILKDASVGRDKKEIFQNQSVQTVNSIQNCKVLPFLPDQFKVLCEDKSTSDHGPIQVGTVSSKQEKSKSNTTKPIYNMIFFNKGHGNYGFTITQSRVKPFYNKSDRIKLSDLKKAKQETGNYTDEPKVTPKKRGLRRFLDILKVGKLKKNKKQRNQVKLSNNTISLKNDEVETPQTKVNTVHEVVKSVINPQTCNSDFCMPIKHDFQINKEKKSKKIISNIVCKSRANTGLTSQSANFPRIKNISSNLSNKTELHIPVNKYASSARKVFNSLRFSLDVPFKRKDVINEKFFQNASKVLNTKSYTKSSHIPTLLNSKKKDRSKFFGPKIKRCLYTLKLHKRGKCNKKSCEVNTETESKIMSEIKYSDLSKGPMSKKSNNTKERPYQFNRSKPLVLLCMPHKYSTEKKHDSSKSFGPYSINTKTISNSINTRKLMMDNRTTKLLYVNKALCKQRCRPSKRIKYSGKQPEKPRFSKKSFSPSINSHKYEILSENNNNREQRINKNNLNNVKNTQRHQTVSGRYSYSENICTCSRMTRSSNKHLCTYKILKNNEQCCSKLFAPSTVYTTNTVTFGQTKSKTPDILLKNTYCDTTKETLLFKSKFKCKSNHVKNQKSRINRKELMNPAQLTGVPPLVRRRYCTTMNVQVTGRNVRRKHHYYSSRLESIPYQYQKCIMERFVRKVPTVSDTERRLKTSPNSTPSVSSGSRTRRNFLKLNHKDKHQPAYARPIGGFRYQSSPRFRQPYKQEEPVGFTFGYSDFPERESNPKRQTTSRSSRTYDKYVKDSGNHTVGRCQRQSQTMMSQIVRRASNVSPMLRQCFYSLKLQKKGRLQKAREMESINQDKLTKIIADEPVTKSTQNTKKQHYPDLVPYEHESSNCVPDECDPTWLENKERLKLRQRRRKQTEDFRADSITSHFSLTPNMISSWESREKRTQFHKYGGHRGPVRSRDIFVQPNPCEIIIEKSAIQRPRQSHIINPRLSFNKEKTHYINKKEHINFRKYAYTHGKMRNRLSRDERQKCDTDSQTVLRKHGRSSGFLKRCYCALQFLTPIRKYRRKSNTVTRMGHERTLSTLDTHIVETPSTRAPKRVRKREHFSKQIILDELSYHPYVQIAPIKCSRPRRYKNHTANCKKRTRDRISRETESFRKRISQIDVSKTRNKILWLKLRRCFSKLKFHRQIPTPEKGLIPPHEEITTLYNSRSVITPNKLRPLPSNLEHYECEPVFCVPDNYDLYKYKNRIKRLDICSSVPSTEGSLSKSNSITECQHRFLNSKPQSVMQPQSIKTRKHQYEVRRAQYITNIVHTPSKRTSNIFRIDFLKDKPPDGGVTDFKPITQHIVHKKPERVPNKLTNIPVTYKSSKKQIERGLHDKDSQVLARKMHSKMTGVGPYLKKCFCTLQLHKSPDRPFSFAMNAAQTVTKPKLNAFSTESATYTRKPYQFHSRKLRPYECEPGDYVPGLYDSYRCDHRKMLSKYSNTHPFRVPSNSSSMQDKTKCKRTQSGFCRPTQKNVRTYHRGDGHSLDKNEYLREDPFLYDSGAYRQAVQVRSSFNFNIDFCKNGSPQISSVCDINRNIKKEMKDTGTSSTRTRSVSSSSNKSYIRDCQSQSECIKTEGKASRASLLQSFFCTLKLQKKEKPQYAKSEIMPLTESVGFDAKKQIIVPVTRKIGTKTEQKYPYILEPYECRLGVCVPGYCDPYDCRKRKKLRNMRHPGIGSIRITKSMSSVTSKDVETKVMNTYLYKQMRDRRRTASTETIYLIKKQLQQLSHVNNNRYQSISWESGCRINKGFMKDSRFVKENVSLECVCQENVTHMSVKREIKDEGSDEYLVGDDLLKYRYRARLHSSSRAINVKKHNMKNSVYHTKWTEL
ncbi:uncharacterized protein LOC111349409 [Spodoptera litura]|uniref:Uncharacterized protein LOC111349409 n=1 Tax=Spodoptera litura TaxID=69820 RepID=A0A9J7DQ08_SPOLT|nr:uncharacterized protein LOC111349409 [Spodoptera litura]